MRPARRLLSALFLFCATAPSSALLAQAQEASSDYKIGPQDLLRISVLEDPTLNREVRVSTGGFVQLPHAELVNVQGLTVLEATKRLEEALGRVLQRATVTIEIQEFRAQPIAVMGAVAKPGNLPFSGRWTLLRALTQAGGLSANHGNKILILRRGKSGLSDRLEISVDDLFVGGDPTVDVPIFANDLINVPPAAEVTIYCLGEFNSPGAIVFSSRERVTVLAALARTGGLGERASSKLRIQREGEEDIVLKVKEVLRGDAPDLALRDGDVLWVKESFF